MSSFYSFVGGMYRLEKGQDDPVRFQVTMEPELASEVIAIAEASNTSRSAAIGYLVEEGLNALRSQYEMGSSENLQEKSKV